MRYQIHRGGLARTVKGVEARKKIDRELHGVVIAAQGDRTVAEVAEIAARATNWWTDLRRGQNVVYGSLFRFLDIAIATGTPKEVLKTIPAMIDWYIEDNTGRTPPQHIKLVA
jgi:hypothetical protein